MYFNGKLYFRRTLSRDNVHSKHSLSDIFTISEMMNIFVEVNRECSGVDLVANQTITIKVTSTWNKLPADICFKKTYFKTYARKQFYELRESRQRRIRQFFKQR